MGEIADALRRARSVAVGTGAAEPAAAPSRGQSGPSGAKIPALTPPSRARRQPDRTELERLTPVDGAIVIADGPNLEACRQLAVQLRGQLEASKIRSVAIVSALRNEGKTTVLCDLGLALASLSSRRDVAIVDLDLRKPSIAEVLGLPVEYGVEHVLRGEADLDDVRISVANPALDIYPAAAPQRASHELLVLPTLGRMIAELEQRYSVVLVDTSPALLVPDANLILRHVAAAIPIARAGRTRVRSFRRLVDQLPRGRILCELLNGTSSLNSDEGYYGAEHPERRESARPPARRGLPWRKR